VNEVSRPQLDFADVEALMTARHRDSFKVLGPHDGDGGRTVRAFLPGARSVEVLRRADRSSLGKLTESQPGLFEGPVSDASPYLLRIEWPAAVQETEDPYAFGPAVDLVLRLGVRW
jgi:1,4-alpha-glucan branching enzyme